MRRGPQRSKDTRRGRAERGLDDERAEFRRATKLIQRREEADHTAGILEQRARVAVSRLRRSGSPVWRTGQRRPPVEGHGQRTIRAIFGLNVGATGSGQYTELTTLYLGTKSGTFKNNAEYLRGPVQHHFHIRQPGPESNS